MSDCILCKIVNKEIPASVVYEDDEIIAFNDINPVAPIHILVIPKEHIEKFADLDETNMEIVTKIGIVINKIVEEKGIKEKGFRVVTNSGQQGGQVVPHLHFHILGGRQLVNEIG